MLPFREMAFILTIYQLVGQEPRAPDLTWCQVLRAPDLLTTNWMRLLGRLHPIDFFVASLLANTSVSISLSNHVDVRPLPFIRGQVDPLAQVVLEVLYPPMEFEDREL